MAVSPADAITNGTFSTPLAAITWPNGAPPDTNMLIAFAISNNNLTITPPSTGATWNVLISQTNLVGSSFQTIWAGWKVASGEPTTQSWTLSASAKNLVVSMMSFSGAVSTAPQFAQTTSTTSSVSTSAALVPAALNALPVVGFGMAPSVTALSTPAGYTSQTTAGGATTGYWNEMATSNTLTSSTSTAWPAATCTATGTATSSNAFLFIIAQQNVPYQPNYQRAAILAQ